jgi:hypothetical protein
MPAQQREWRAKCGRALKVTGFAAAPLQPSSRKITKFFQFNLLF